MIDVRADDRIDDGDAAKFEATARACALAGWDYRRIGALDPVLAANLRWLAGYRHPRYAMSAYGDDLAQAFARPLALMDGARAVGDPIAVLPALFNLLWRRVLLVDVTSALLASRSVVWSPGGGPRRSPGLPGCRPASRSGWGARHMLSSRSPGRQCGWRMPP